MLAAVALAACIGCGHAAAEGVLRVGNSAPPAVSDELMPSYSEDCRLKAKAIAVPARSFVEIKQFETEPDTSKLYAQCFLPTQTVTQ